MITINRKDGESLDSMIRRFKRKTVDSGIVQEIRERQEYVKPSVKKKLKHEAELKRRAKEARKKAKKYNCQ